MTIAVEGTGPANLAGEDAVRPFAVEALDVRGRAIQMGPVLDRILASHDYPPAVSRLLAEVVVLAVLLGSSLKFDGRFILQTQTDGPVDMLVVDYRTNGDIRAYARFNADRLAAFAGEGSVSSGTLLGTGTLAMTVDQGADMNSYQGVVALEGDSLEDVAHAYFRQSEQIPTRVRLAVAEMHVRGAEGLRRSWRAGGLLAQFLPDSTERVRARDLPGGDAPVEDSSFEEAEEDDAWVEALALTGTIQDDELTDPSVPVDRLLYRLFHERGVRVFDAVEVRDKCSCSRDRVAGMLSGFSAEEISESVENGAITVRCEFCGRSYGFDPAEFSSKPAGDLPREA